MVATRTKSRPTKREKNPFTTKKRNPFFQKSPDVFVDITLQKVKSSDDPLLSKNRKDVESFEFHLDHRKIGVRGRGIP